MTKWFNAVYHMFILYFLDSTTFRGYIFAGFLAQMKSLEFAFRINWPLEGHLPSQSINSAHLILINNLDFRFRMVSFYSRRLEMKVIYRKSPKNTVWWFYCNQLHSSKLNKHDMLFFENSFSWLSEYAQGCDQFCSSSLLLRFKIE